MGTEQDVVTLEAELLLPDLPELLAPYPASLPEPRLHARWIIDEELTLTFIEIGDIAMHVETTDDDVAWHLHVGGHDGPPLEGTPWDEPTTALLLEWMAEFVGKVHACIEMIDDDIFDAVDLFEAGATSAQLSPASFEPEDWARFTRNDFKLFRVSIPGHAEPQIWTGSGDAWHMHDEERNGDAELLWAPPGSEDENHIHLGAVIISPETGLPATFANPGINWDDVGMAEDEAMDWLLREHRNCVWASTIHDALTEEVLKVLAGFTAPVPSPHR
ncbi:hypothetical protein [Mycetocola zhadangensis]|uniref:Uncharacterized protein n=1 Tax=Mycetocola zhadangensis TaxID=1164595 RepID=A0A3L7J769_9MICO|nr:hypothetical protein [Mycetocola zhadangensis]RLQ86390.1 hypothetical protein D9V28_06130 [Mycetocola zhadangensis]GGE90802.1 hypothetical protein GCM10011313_12110 [Mycetocola zhadangensis]